MNDEFIFLWAQWGILDLASYKKVLAKYGTFEKAWKQIDQSFLLGLGFSHEKVKRSLKIKEKISFKSIIDTVEHLSIKLYAYSDEAYPSYLKESSAPPPFIWVRGKLPSFAKSISVVGTRAASFHGKAVTQKFTADLVRHNFVIVSGLALGIDSVAHKTTTEGHGITVAVLGTGVDEIYPRSNYRLAQEIIRLGGAIISAYPLGSPALPYHFRARNSIIAGLSRGTLVIEGGVKSGALITAREALKAGREVFAVPNQINNYGLSGTNHLIRRSEAKLVENIDHLLEDLGMHIKTMKEAHDFDFDELKILEKLGQGSRTVDELCHETTYDIPLISNILIKLLLKGVALQQGERWVLV